MARTISRRWQPAIGLGLCGTVTGCISWLISFYDIDPLIHVLGVVFGIAVAVYLIAMIGLSLARAALIVLFFGASWQLAYRIAIEIHDSIDNMIIIGALAGALGAAVLTACFALLFKGFRTAVPILRTILVGAAAGTLLNVDSGPAMAVLFIIWQTSVGASLGFGGSVFEPD